MAGLIPQSFIDDLLSRADIVDVVDGRVALKKTGKNYSGLCPFHQEKSPSFTVEPDKQFYYCFGCGAGGNAIGFVMNYENLDFPQAIEALASDMGIEVPREESGVAQKQREQHEGLFDVLEKASAYYQLQLRQHKDKARAISYLKERGLSGEIARDFALGYAPPGWDNLLKQIGTSAEQQNLLLKAGMLIEKPENQKNPYYDRFRDRIIYPIRDTRGRVIGFGGRVLGDDKPKYLNSPETPVFHKGEELYGLYEAKKKVRKLERFLIVEGYMDVIALAQNDIPWCVATLGTATSSNHLRRLFKLVSEVVFCFDGDNAGREAAWRALLQVLPLMEDGRSARFLFLPEGQDPDSQVRRIGTEAFVASVNEATQLADFFFENLSAKIDMNSLEGRARLGNMAMPHIQKLPKSIYRQLMQDQLARLTGVDSATLGQMNPEPEPAPLEQAPPHFSQESSPAATQMPEQLTAIPSQAQNSNKYQVKTTGWSACMRAVNLLIMKPEIVRTVDSSNELAEIRLPDMDLLLKVIELASTWPNCTTPEIMGRLYATSYGAQLTHLLGKEQITPVEGVEKEFSDIISHLLNEHRRKRAQAAILEQARQRLLGKSQENPPVE